jgi:RNA processing factor Prp31
MQWRFSAQFLSRLNKTVFSGRRQSDDTIMKNSMTDEEQIILIDKLLEEMALLRHRFDELQEWEFSDLSSCVTAREKLSNDIHCHASDRMDAIELLLKSLTKIQNLINEVQNAMRPSSHDAM